MNEIGEWLQDRRLTIEESYAGLQQQESDTETQEITCLAKIEMIDETLRQLGWSNYDIEWVTVRP